MADWYRAQDTLAAELENGSHVLVNKGDVLQGGHELVKRDLDAQKANSDRIPLFVLLEPDEAPKAPAKGRSAKAEGA